MEVVITLGWWTIPSIITVAVIVWALFIYNDGGGWLSGIGNLFMLIPALLVSLIAWIIAAFLK